MMFFQETTANTDGYMIAGFVITFVVMGLYVASIFVRTRNLKQDQATLEEMDKPVAKASAPSKPKQAAKATKAKPAAKKAKKK
jgi:hypothetical protein